MSSWANFVFAFHDGQEIGPKMLARIAKHAGLKPDDLYLLVQKSGDGLGRVCKYLTRCLSMT